MTYLFWFQNPDPFVAKFSKNIDSKSVSTRIQSLVIGKFTFTEFYAAGKDLNSVYL